jgi:hypothetical protein
VALAWGLVCIFGGGTIHSWVDGKHGDKLRNGGLDCSVRLKNCSEAEWTLAMR